MSHPRDKNNFGPGPADGLAILANTGPRSMPVENGWVAGVNVDGWTGCGAVAKCPVDACLAAVVRTRKWFEMKGSPNRPQGQGVSMSQKNYKIGQSNEVNARNYTDADGKPAGGYAHGPGMCIAWQDGPRGQIPNGTLNPANGAFVEDALVAARQRLDFFQQSQFAHEANAEAIRHIDYAIECLNKRALERKARGVLGVNAV